METRAAELVGIPIKVSVETTTTKINTIVVKRSCECIANIVNLPITIRETNHARFFPMTRYSTNVTPSKTATEVQTMKKLLTTIKKTPVRIFVNVPGLKNADIINI